MGNRARKKNGRVESSTQPQKTTEKNKNVAATKFLDSEAQINLYDYDQQFVRKISKEIQKSVKRPTEFNPPASITPQILPKPNSSSKISFVDPVDESEDGQSTETKDETELTTVSISAVEAINLIFYYDQQGADWNTVFKIGRNQSPIDLFRNTAIGEPIKPIKFHNYTIPLQTPAKLRNTGYSAAFSVPPTIIGERAGISGAGLDGIYDAINVHFHWGSETTKGSEHRIDRQRYDAEMQIVHRKKGYTQQQALTKPDGFAVLAVMIQITENANSCPALSRIFNSLPYIINPFSITFINGQLNLRQLLGITDTREFYHYKGSITTPPCPEGVLWIVFPEPLRMRRKHIARLWRLLEFRRKPMINNFRCIQPANNRHVVYKEA